MTKTKKHPWRVTRSGTKDTAWQKVSVLPVIEPPEPREIADIASSLPAFPWQDFVQMRKNSGY